jgi:hypothetical protein
MIKNLLIITLRKIIYENRIKTVRFVALVFKRNGNKKIAIKIIEDLFFLQQIFYFLTGKKEFKIN